MYDMEYDPSCKAEEQAEAIRNGELVLVTWPESQDYMEELWFPNEAVLDVSGRHGDAAYWIPKQYKH